MQNAKSFVGKNYLVESNVTVATPDGNFDNENVFLIGLNFNGSLDSDVSGKNRLHTQNKIPMIMLKIDAEKIISAHNSDTKTTSTKRYTSNRALNEFAENPVKEIYSVDYNTSENNLPHENLSYRELQVMKLIALGKARKEIADELFLSISTINTYRARILEKMNMKNNAEIMRYAFQHKFVE